MRTVGIRQFLGVQCSVYITSGVAPSVNRSPVAYAASCVLHTDPLCERSVTNPAQSRDGTSPRNPGSMATIVLMVPNLVLEESEQPKGTWLGAAVSYEFAYS